MALDLSTLVLIAPIFAFLIVAFVVAAILLKTGILGKNKWVIVFVSLAIASLFVSAAGTREYVITIIPWFAALLVSFFLILLVLGLAGANAPGLHKGLGIAFMVLLGIIFIVSAFVVFSHSVFSYLPGPSYGDSGANSNVLFFFNWLYSPRVYGAIFLIIASALTAWILVKAK